MPSKRRCSTRNLGVISLVEEVMEVAVMVDTEADTKADTSTNSLDTRRRSGDKS